MIQKYEVGKEVTLDIWSEGETSQIKVTLEEVE
jgi:hypothetical protein